MIHRKLTEEEKDNIKKLLTDMGFNYRRLYPSVPFLDMPFLSFHGRDLPLEIDLSATHLEIPCIIKRVAELCYKAGLEEGKGAIQRSLIDALDLHSYIHSVIQERDL